MDRYQTRCEVLLNCISDGAVIHRHGVIVYANDSILRMIGANIGDSIVGLCIWRFIHKDDRASVITRYQRLMASAQEGVSIPSHDICGRCGDTDHHSSQNWRMIIGHLADFRNSSSHGSESTFEYDPSLRQQLAGMNR